MQNSLVVDGGTLGPAYLVRLRPATLDDTELLNLWSSSEEYTGRFNDFGATQVPKADEPIGAKGLAAQHGGGTLLVERLPDHEPVGTVSWRQVHYGPNPESLAWQIGINLIPEARGRGFGGQAQRLLVDYLFSTTPVKRIEAATDIDNLAEQRALEKAGFIREGVLRGAQYRAGTWHDLVFYSVVRVAEKT